MSNCSHVRARLCAIDNTVFAKIFRFVFIHDILRKRRVQFIKFEADRFRVVRSKCFWSETSSRFAPLLSWHDQEQWHEFQAFPSGRFLLIVAVFSPFNYTTKACDLFFSLTYNCFRFDLLAYKMLKVFVCSTLVFGHAAIHSSRVGKWSKTLFNVWPVLRLKTFSWFKRVLERTWEVFMLEGCKNEC